MTRSCHWNYRVLRDENSCTLIECYYEDEEIVGWTVGSAVPWGEDLEELRGDLELMQGALSKPVLKPEDLP